MPWVAGVGAAVGAIGGGLLSAGGSKDAAKEQRKAAEAQIAFQKWLFEQQTALQAPFREGGLTGMDRYMTLLGLDSPTSDNALNPDFGKYAGEFDASKFQQDPGYAFRLSEGLKAVDRQAAARGGLVSGNALKASQQYGQEAASEEYMNAYNRYYNDRSQALNPLASLFGAGQQATNQIQQAGSEMGQNVNNSYADIGNARASSYAGQSQAWGNALNQLGNIGMDYYYMNRNPSTSSSGGFSSGSGRSDIRLKTNIRRIGQRGPLTLYSWSWNGRLGMSGDTIGYIAQEVASVFPEAVSEREGYLTLDYSMLPTI